MFREIVSVNKAQCKKCESILESLPGDQPKVCSCGALTVWGGHESIKRLGVKEDVLEMSVCEIEPTKTV